MSDVSDTSSLPSSHVPIMQHHTEMHSAPENICTGPSRVFSRSIEAPINWLTGGSSLAQRQRQSNTDTSSGGSSSSAVSSPSSSQNVVMVDGFEVAVGSSWLSRHKTTASMRTILEEDLLGTLPTPYNILNWMKDLRVLRVCKTDRMSLTAFASSPQSLLCYVDPWQVTIIDDPAQILSPHLTDATLGRSRYCPLNYEHTGETFMSQVFGKEREEKQTFPTSPEDPTVQMDPAHKRLLSLWGLVAGDSYVINTLKSAVPRIERDSMVPPSSVAMGVLPGSVAEDLYIAAIQRHLYRNALFARVAYPHRFIAIVNLKILGMKDHNSQRHRGLVQPGPMDLYSTVTLTRTPSSSTKVEAMSQTYAQSLYGSMIGPDNGLGNPIEPVNPGPGFLSLYIPTFL